MNTKKLTKLLALYLPYILLLSLIHIYLTNHDFAHGSRKVG